MPTLSCSLTALCASLAKLTNRELLDEVERLASDERQATARLIASLVELDIRRLYRDAGYSSMFTYCTQALHLSEHAAYRRIEAARTAHKFPVILERLEAGRLTLTAIGMLGPLLTAENYVALLDAVDNKSKREIEHLVARIHPQPDVPALIRRVRCPRPSAPEDSLETVDDRRATERHSAPEGSATALQNASDGSKSELQKPDSGQDCSKAGPATVATPGLESIVMTAKPRSVVLPLAPERYKLQVTISAETYAKLCRAQDLLRHVIPDGDPACILDRALTELVTQIEKTRLAATNKPRAAREAPPTSRHIPASVRRAVWARDEGRCTYVGTHGRCKEQGFLQLHHRVPFAAGGVATEGNLELRCAAHNALDADTFFGSNRINATCRHTTAP